jgi:hypothetical protein
MDATYVIRRLPPEARALPLEKEFDRRAVPQPYLSLREAAIAHYQWGRDYAPPAFARVGWNDAGLAVLMYAYEDTISTNHARFGGRVCEDSCLEFFVMPDPARDARYINIEVNPNGVAHIGIGEGRRGRRRLLAPPPGFSVAHSAFLGTCWAVSYLISAEFLRTYFEGLSLAPGHEMKGNFYACDESIHPHFGAHFPVRTEKPDFHRSAYFGKLLLI